MPVHNIPIKRNKMRVGDRIVTKDHVGIITNLGGKGIVLDNNVVVYHKDIIQWTRAEAIDRIPVKEVKSNEQNKSDN